MACAAEKYLRKCCISFFHINMGVSRQIYLLNKCTALTAEFVLLSLCYLIILCKCSARSTLGNFKCFHFGNEMCCELFVPTIAATQAILFLLCEHIQMQISISLVHGTRTLFYLILLASSCRQQVIQVYKNL